MAIQLNTSFLRNASGKEAAEYLKELRQESSPEYVTQQFLHAVERGSLPAATFAIWLEVSRSPFAIQQALCQKVSIRIRKAGITQLGKQLTSVDWRETWDTLGGIPGILEIYSDLSVSEVGLMSSRIGKSAGGQDGQEKREIYTDLFKSLFPELFPNAPYRNMDKRPLGQYLLGLIGGCTESFVEEWWMKNAPKELQESVRQHNLVKNFPHASRSKAFSAHFGNKWHNKSSDRLITLISHSSEGPSHEPGFSPSMQFLLDILRRLADGESSSYPYDWVIPRHVMPLLKRAMQKKVAWVKIEEILELTAKYLGQRSAASDRAEISNEELLHWIVKCWARQPEQFEDHFRLLLRQSCQKDTFYEITCFKNLLEASPKSKRYELLTLCFKEINGIDLDNGNDLKRVRGALTPSFLLDTLSDSDALNLLTRSRKARGDDDLIQPQLQIWEQETNNSILRMSIARGQQAKDPDIFHVFLLQKNGFLEEAKEKAKSCEERNRKLAMSSSDQEERAYYANKALHYAISSGSLQVYKEAITWAQRFIRDPLTARSLFSSQPEELALLLSGIPEIFTKSISLLSVRNHVSEGNQLLITLFETICSALQEPSFAVYHWDGTLQLFLHTVEQRISRSHELKNVLGLSDGELYQTLWEGMIETIVTVEEKALRDEHKRLEVHFLGGILGRNSFDTIQLNNEEPATYMFFDNLAKARNRIWYRFRPTIHPATAALPAPFPRGLPLQYLIRPFSLDAPNLESSTPYIAYRVKETLFPNPETVLAPVPTDKESWKAIGHFVDEYAVALRMYVPKTLGENEKKRRVEKAWTYATGVLSHDRMSSAEATRFWQEQNREGLTEFWPPQSATEGNKKDWLLIPQVDNPSEIEEWNPLPPVDERKEIEERNLNILTYVDLSMKICQSKTPTVDISSVLQRFTAIVPARVADTRGTWGWVADETAKIEPDLREGLILSALLFIDTKLARDSRILTAPYPSKNECRFPALNLDEECLSYDGNDWERAVDALEKHANYVPVGLLEKVTNNAVASLIRAKSEEDPSSSLTLQPLAFRLMRLLLESDRPFMVSDMSISIITRRPDASSWHRMLFSRKLLLRTPASEAQSCFDSFSSSIIDQLKKQEDAKAAASLKARSANPVVKRQENESTRPYVKVTTIKYLVDLLDRPVFVSHDTAISILSSISAVATHIDIRLALAHCLLRNLTNERSHVTEKRLGILESVIPLAGELNERQPMSENDWARVEETLELPEIQDPQRGIDFKALYPILDALINYARREWLQPGFPDTFVARIVLPTLDRLKEQTARWNAIFLRKHGFDEDSQKDIMLPPVPRSIWIIKRLFDCGPVHYLPCTLLEEYVAYLTFNIAPPPQIKAINEKFQGDPALRSAPEIKTWLRLYGLGVSGGTPKKVKEIPMAMIGSKSKLGEDEGITDKMIQEQTLKLFTAILWNDSPRYENLTQFTKEMFRGDFYDSWEVHGKEVLQAMVLYIETLRSEQWARDPNRQPQVLPDVFPLRLHLLDAPKNLRYLPKEEQEQKCNKFAAQISKIIDRLAGTVYARKLEQIKNFLQETFYTYDQDNKIRFALCLGDITKTRLSWLTQQDQLRVEVAAHLIQSAYNAVEPARELDEKLDSMLKSWSKSESEEVRRLGLTISVPWVTMRRDHQNQSSQRYTGSFTAYDECL